MQGRIQDVFLEGVHSSLALLAKQEWIFYSKPFDWLCSGLSTPVYEV